MRRRIISCALIGDIVAISQRAGALPWSTQWAGGLPKELVKLDTRNAHGNIRRPPLPKSTPQPTRLTLAHRSTISSSHREGQPTLPCMQVFIFSSTFAFKSFYILMNVINKLLTLCSSFYYPVPKSLTLQTKPHPSSTRSRLSNRSPRQPKLSTTPRARCPPLPSPFPRD